jgi:hypothetical protein
VSDGNEVKVEGIGSFILELSGGFNLRLQDVLYVPSLKRNLISVLQLDKLDIFVSLATRCAILSFIIFVLALGICKANFICSLFIKSILR